MENIIPDEKLCKESKVWVSLNVVHQAETQKQILMWNSTKNTNYNFINGQYLSVFVVIWPKNLTKYRYKYHRS